MKIEIAYALEDEQFLFTEQVNEGTTALQALKQSKLLQMFPDLNVDKIGNFSQLVSHEYVLKEGDRIEVYRPLKADPRERRRKNVEAQRSQR